MLSFETSAAEVATLWVARNAVVSTQGIKTFKLHLFNSDWWEHTPQRKLGLTVFERTFGALTSRSLRRLLSIRRWCIWRRKMAKQLDTWSMASDISARASAAFCSKASASPSRAKVKFAIAEGSQVRIFVNKLSSSRPRFAILRKLSALCEFHTKSPKCSKQMRIWAMLSSVTAWMLVCQFDLNSCKARLSPRGKHLRIQNLKVTCDMTSFAIVNPQDDHDMSRDSPLQVIHSILSDSPKEEYETSTNKWARARDIWDPFVNVQLGPPFSLSQSAP